MPTSDPIRRRQQNRENQKKFRKKQLQNLADLRAAYDAQTLKLHEAEARIVRLQRKVVAAERLIRSCDPALACFQDAVHEFASIDSGLTLEQDSRLWLETDDSSQIQIHRVTDEGTSVRTPGVSQDDAPGSSLSADTEWSDAPQHTECLFDLSNDIQPQNVVQDDVDQWLQSPITTIEGPVEAVTAEDVFRRSETPPLDLAGWNMGVQSHAVDNLNACLQTEYGNSRLSKHIITANSLIQQEYKGLMPKRNFSTFQAVADAVAWIMQSWSSSIGCLEMMTVYQELRNYEIWRNFPTEANLKRIHPMYRPTVAQILCPHAPAVDWLPWPALRDKVIELQDSLDIDALNTKALFHTVIERSEQDETNPMLDSMRIWDIYSLEASKTTKVSGPAKEPVDVKTYLQKRGIRVDDISNLRLDLAFFEAFPALWQPELCSRRSIVPMPSVMPQPLLYPRDLEPGSLGRLKSLLGATESTVLEMHKSVVETC